MKAGGGADLRHVRRRNQQPQQSVPSSVEVTPWSRCRTPPAPGMPQPGLSGMEPAFGEAYGGHRALLSPYPLATSPHRGRTEYDQSILLMLGSPASPRKRPFELLSDLVDDGGLGEELHPERWDVSSLDEMARFTKLGLGVGGELLACSEEAVLMGRWGRGREEEEEEHSTPAYAQEDRKGGGCGSVALTTEVQFAEVGKESAGAEGEVLKRCRVEVYQVATEEEQKEEAAAALEPCNEHNYSLSQGGEEEEPPGQGSSEEGQGRSREEEEEDDEEEEEDGEEEEAEDGEEETAVEAELSSSSETECDVGAEPAREAEPVRGPAQRPSKRRCFWEYRCARETAAKRKVGGATHWSLSWSSSTLPSTLYRREGKKGRRKARKTDASDLTPNPQKLLSIGEQLQHLHAAIEGMAPLSKMAAGARARSRKEKNKLASRACRLKKKAQHEANKIKLWGLNQEYDQLLGALLRIKELIRLRVENVEEEEEERGMSQRLEDILRESSGPLVAGRTKDFVQRILAASAGGQTHRDQDQEAG